MLVKTSYWLMRGNLEMLMVFLKLLALPSICLPSIFALSFLKSQRCYDIVWGNCTLVISIITTIDNWIACFCAQCHFTQFMVLQSEKLIIYNKNIIICDDHKLSFYLVFVFVNCWTSFLKKVFKYQHEFKVTRHVCLKIAKFCFL